MQDGSFNWGLWIPIISFSAAILIIILLAVIIGKRNGLGFLKTLANLFWLVFVGWEMAIIYFLVGVICCIFIIFIPIGIQYFKFARLAFWPFGYQPVFTKLNGFKMFINVLWIIFGGWEGALVCLILGGLCCITVVLIPCGLQLFKFARLSVMPLGTTIEKIS